MINVSLICKICIIQVQHSFYFAAITDNALKQKAGRHLLELQAGIILEFPKQSIQYVDRDSLGPISLIWFGELRRAPLA